MSNSITPQMFGIQAASRIGIVLGIATMVFAGSVSDAVAQQVIDEEGLNMNIFYVSSAELFSLLPEDEQEKIFPEECAMEAMGITGLTMPTLCRWVTSRCHTSR